MFKQLILDNQEKIKNLKVFKRDYEFYYDLLNLNKIISFVGPRRVGKTYLMFQFLKELLEKNIITDTQILFIDFSQFRNETLSPQLLLDNYFEINPEKEPFIVFDEIQDITNFIEFTLFFYNKGYKIFLSGSNSKLLSSELATEFSGRVFQYDVFPLTFKETLLFRGIQDKKNYSSQEKGELNNLLQEILTYGSYPEIILTKNISLKENLLKDYLDILIYKDLTERYKIDNDFLIRYLVKKIIQGNTKEFSVNKIFNELKSLNIKVGKNTLYNYLGYLENIFFVKQISNEYSLNGLKKVFLYNIGFKTVFNQEKDIGSSFENFIFLHLLKKYKNIRYKSKTKEIDFYIEKENKNIQVCYELNESNFSREVDFGSKGGENILIYKENFLELKDKNVIFNYWIDFLLED